MEGKTKQNTKPGQNDINPEMHAIFFFLIEHLWLWWKPVCVVIASHAICGVFKKKGQDIDFTTAEFINCLIFTTGLWKACYGIDLSLAIMEALMTI